MEIPQNIVKEIKKYFTLNLDNPCIVKTKPLPIEEFHSEKIMYKHLDDLYAKFGVKILFVHPPKDYSVFTIIFSI